MQAESQLAALEKEMKEQMEKEKEQVCVEFVHTGAVCAVGIVGTATAC